MIEIRPFRALHYDTAVVGDLAAVIAPPYDVIGDAEVERLYARHPQNVVRLILNRDADRYGAARRTLVEWRSTGVLVRDAAPHFYLYVQDFTVHGAARQRCGIIAALRLERFEDGNVRPHERTFARAKEDRLRLLRACRTNLSPLFGLYADRADVLTELRARCEQKVPWIDVTDDAHERHRVWQVSDPGVARALSDRTVFIADGHHRYETALAYRDELRAQGQNDPDAPHNFVMMYLTSMSDPGLAVLPTHRVLQRIPEGALAIDPQTLAGHFAVEEVAPGDRHGLIARLNAAPERGVIGLCIGSRRLLLRLRAVDAVEAALAEYHPVIRRLDVTLLDAFVLRRLFRIDCTRAAQEGALTYTHDDERALAAPAGGAVASFLVRAPRIEQVEEACMAGQTMPEKSTYFYPKLLSGLVFHSLEE